MARSSASLDSDLDAVLRGDAATPDSHGLEQLVLALRSDAAHHGAPPMGATLHEQVTAMPLATARARRRRIVLAGVAGLLAGGATLGVAGAQGALPTPLQDTTARAATIVGVDLPDSHDDSPGTARDSDTTEPGGTGSDREGDADPQGSGADPQGSGADPQGSGADPQGPSTDPPGPPVTTGSGTEPADPGTPGDHEPATPATPGNGNPDRGESGKAKGSENGTGPGTANGKGPGANHGKSSRPPD